MTEPIVEYDFNEYYDKPVETVAYNYGAILRDDETDEELRRRLIKRVVRFSNPNASLYDLVHVAEQAIYGDSPVGIDHSWARRQVALGLINKNKHGSRFTRFKYALKAFWAAL